MKRNTVYIVSMGLEGGYTPNQVLAFATLAEARSYMVEEAKFSRVILAEKVSGSAKAGLYILDSGTSLNHYIMLDESTLPSLGLSSYDDLESYNDY